MLSSSVLRISISLLDFSVSVILIDIARYVNCPYRKVLTVSITVLEQMSLRQQVF